MPRTKKSDGHPIESYAHAGKERLNNPPIGLVTPDTDPDAGKQTYAYDPHLDPQLVWAGKVEHTSFEVPTVSLHVHERIDPLTIVEAVRRAPDPDAAVQFSLFETASENPPMRDAIDFYRHPHGWSNRLVAGDSLLVMNSLLEKEGMAGKVQMVYIDPPYGIKYGSNFQPFVNKRDVKDGKDEDLTAEPEQIRAFRDTWELGIHSYLTYLRDRLLLARELLTEGGSVFVQISDENLHHVRELMDEVFSTDAFVGQICFQKTTGQSSETVSSVFDYLVWYCKDRSKLKFRQLYKPKYPGEDGATEYNKVDLPDGSIRQATDDELSDIRMLPANARLFSTYSLFSAGEGKDQLWEFTWIHNERPITVKCPRGYHFKTGNDIEKLGRLAELNRLVPTTGQRILKRYFDDFPWTSFSNLWADTRGEPGMVYVVQTAAKVIQRCMLMTTDPGDLAFDPTCGSGTTAYVAERWGRRWITCDTSRVALTLAKQRLMTAVYDYYELAHPEEGVGSGFRYKTVPHVMLKSIANNEPPGMETLYDQPYVDNHTTRVSGPFTTEAVPAPTVRSVDDLLPSDDVGAGLAPALADASISRSGETLRQGEWRDELLRTGIRGKAGQHIRFARLEPLPGCRWLHADGETRQSNEGADSVKEDAPAYVPMRAVVSFGSEHAPLDKRQVESALQEAMTLLPRPKLLVFAAFQFDPEAAKDVDETKWPGVTLLKAQMNADMLTDDLKKKRASNESFWLIGQPDVAVASEQWLVDSRHRMVMPYELCEVLSGAGGLAKINAIDPSDLQFYAAIAQRGDLWVDLADSPGGGLASGKHREGSSSVGDGGVHSVSGHRAGFVGRIGDTDALIQRLGLHDAGRRRELVERLRGSRALAEWASALSLPKPLTTSHYSQVTVHGFDYYNTKTGDLESGGADKIALWLLDTDYDGRSLYPRQVFFPIAGDDEGWARLARVLKAEIDPDLIEAYRGTVSLPFIAGPHKRIAVKIVDDRGIESLKVIALD